MALICGWSLDIFSADLMLWIRSGNNTPLMMMVRIAMDHPQLGTQ